MKENEYDLDQDLASEEIQNHFDQMLVNAIDENDLEQVKKAISLGADLDTNDGYPIHTAIENGNLEIFKALLGGNVDPNKHAAVESESLAMLNGLVAHGADVNYERAFHTPLSAAIAFKHPEMVDLLLEHGADVKALDGRAVLVAAEQNDFGLVERLGKLGAEIDLYNKEILHAAVEHSLEAVKICESLGADIHYNGSALLKHATCYGSIETMNYLIEQGQDIHNQGQMGNDCLSLAAGMGATDKVEFLLEKGANPNATKNILADAILHGHNQTAIALLQAGSDPHVNNDNPIYQAAKVNPSMFNYLLFDMKVPLSEQTRKLFKDLSNPESFGNGKHAEPFKDAVKLIDKRDLNDRLQERFNKPQHTKTKSKGFTLKI